MKQQRRARSLKKKPPAPPRSSKSKAVKTAPGTPILVDGTGREIKVKMGLDKESDREEFFKTFALVKGNVAVACEIHGISQPCFYQHYNNTDGIENKQAINFKEECEKRKKEGYSRHNLKTGYLASELRNDFLTWQFSLPKEKRDWKMIERYMKIELELAGLINNGVNITNNVSASETHVEQMELMVVDGFEPQLERDPDDDE